jgi:hypothetical protein
MRRLVSVLLALVLLLMAAVPALAAQPPRPEPLTVECNGQTITVEFRSRGIGGGGIVAFHADRPLLALGGTFSVEITDAEGQVVFADEESFRLARGLSEDRMMRCTIDLTFTEEDPELGELTITVHGELLVFAPGRHRS